MDALEAAAGRPARHRRRRSCPLLATRRPRRRHRSPGASGSSSRRRRPTPPRGARPDMRTHRGQRCSSADWPVRTLWRAGPRRAKASPRPAGRHRRAGSPARRCEALGHGVNAKRPSAVSANTPRLASARSSRCSVSARAPVASASSAGVFGLSTSWSAIPSLAATWTACPTMAPIASSISAIRADASPVPACWWLMPSLPPARMTAAAGLSTVRGDLLLARNGAPGPTPAR